MFCTLNGTNPAGRFGSVNAPARLTGAKLLSNTLMLPAAPLAAYRNVPALLIARPVYMAPGVDTSTVEVKPPAQPEIVPLRLAKMNRADVLGVPGTSWKDAVFPLFTCPVGPCGPAPVVGIPTNPLALTVSTWLTFVLPITAYSVLVFVPWLEAQNGLVGLRDTPHGFNNSGSVMVASPGTLETRLVWV